MWGTAILPPMLAMLTMEARRRAGEGLLGAQVGEGGPGGVEGGEEVDLHGALEDLEGLGFDGADVEDAGVVDEDVDAAEAGDGFGDEALGFGGLGEVGGDEVEVVGLEVGELGEEGGLGVLELGEIAGGEDEADGVVSEAGGDGEAQAAGASGDEDDGARGVGIGGGGLAVADGADDQDGGSGGDDGGGDGGYGDSCGGGRGGGGEGGEVESAHMWIMMPGGDLEYSLKGGRRYSSGGWL